MATRLPLANKLLGKIARKGSDRFIDKTMTRLLPNRPDRHSLGGKLAGAALVRIATRSVPGAILVGGALLARAVHRKKQEERAARAGATVAHKPR